MGRLHTLLAGVGCITGGLLIAPAQGAAKEPIVLEPSTKWNVDFGDNKCRLARAFGESDNRHIIFFDQWAPRPKFGFTAAGPSFKRFRSSRDIEIRMGDGEGITSPSPMIGDVEGIGSALIYTSLRLGEKGGEEEDEKEVSFQPTSGTPIPQIDTEFAKGVNSITLRQGNREVVLKVDALSEALTVLNRCSENLIEAWGLDLERHKTLTRRPKWLNEDKVVRQIQSDYPRTALRKGEQAILRMRVNIDAAGVVTDCAIYEATQTQSLESPACKAMMKSKFKPALDAKGEPFPSYHISSITYRIG